MEETNEQINDNVAVDAALDAALEDQSLIIAKVPDRENELSNNVRVFSMETGETNNAVTQFFGDNINLDIDSIHGNTQLVGSKSPLLHHLFQIHKQQRLSLG